MGPPREAEERILVLAPTGADAVNASQVLTQAGFSPVRCQDLNDTIARLGEGCGALLMTEEAMMQRDGLLAEALAGQPAWSDLPIVLAVSGGHSAFLSEEVVRQIGPRSNITLVERPLRAGTLVSMVKAALRARKRQYEVRDLLKEREEMLASLEARVSERTAKLQELVNELESFSYSVSHDLRAPLRVLEGYARALCEDYADELDEQGRAYLERISKTADRMDRLTQDVLAFSRLSRLEINLVPVDLEKTVTDVIAEYPSLAEARQAFSFHGPLGTVRAHGPSLTQCLSNLLENALKFARPGEPPRVEISSVHRDGRVRLRVRDHGVGIDPQYHAKIFGIFERVAPRDVPGTGIGLAIVKKAVERMGGAVGVESELGKGATFWVELAEASDQDHGQWTIDHGPRAADHGRRTTDH